MSPKKLRRLALEIDTSDPTFIGFENFGKWLGSEFNEIRGALRVAAQALELEDQNEKTT